MKKYLLKITVTPTYLGENQDTSEAKFLFSYDIKINNIGSAPVQIISRHWIITNANGTVQEVKGLGVVGHQPLIKPEQAFEYTSVCPLSTSTGSMKGLFHCVGDDGVPFITEIPEFHLMGPHTLH